MKPLLAIIAFLVASSAMVSPSSFGQQSRERPKELEILGQYVGDWTTDVTSKPAVWTPKGRKFRTSSHAEFVLDGWCLQHIEVNQEGDNSNKVGKSLMLWTIDPKSKKYVQWLFQSNLRASA